MSLVLASLVVVSFAAVVERLELPERAREVVRRGRECVEVMRDPSLDDADKERALQSQSLRLFGLLGILAGGSVLALVLPLGAVWLLDALAVASLAEVLSVLERPDFLLGATVLGGAAYLLVRRLVRR